MTITLKPFIRRNLDILFVGLNPPQQSNSNGHYFSGKQSRFFHLLFKSGLITANINKLIADERIFGQNDLNFFRSDFGVIDLVPDLVETDSNRVKPNMTHLTKLIDTIIEFEPRIVCIIHSKVRDIFNRSKDPRLTGKLIYGKSGILLRDCSSLFFLNYFPNGNNIVDEKKIEIFEQIKRHLG